MHSMSFQIRVYKSNHHSPHHKLFYNLHGEISARTHQLPLEISHKNLAENVILKTGELTLSKKTNTRYKTIFIMLKSLHGQLHKSTIFQK